MIIITSLAELLGPLIRKENSSLLYDKDGYVVPVSNDHNVYTKWMKQRDWWQGNLKQPVWC